MANKVAGLVFRISADTLALRTGMAQAQAGVTKMKSSVKSLGIAMGVTFAAGIVVRGIRNMVQIAMEFEQAMADVAAITRSTGSEFARLETLAKALGRTTRYTSSQVAILEKEYAKLGFTITEIEGAAEATLNLATAVNSDLGRAAQVVGGVIRAYQEDARETTRVTDVMAQSFTSSALDMEKFADAIKYVGPIAANAGLSIEETTALLAILADNMIDSSMAGTSLRMIFTQMAKSGKPLVERLDELSKAGLTLASAEDEVGRRAMTAFLVLSNQSDKIQPFIDSLQDAGGAAKEMADIQIATLTGQLKLLKSAWQGFVLELDNSSPILDDTQSVIGLLAKGINKVTDNMKPATIAWNAYAASITGVYGQILLLRSIFMKRDTAPPPSRAMIEMGMGKYKKYKKKPVSNPTSNIATRPDLSLAGMQGQGTGAGNIQRTGGPAMFMLNGFPHFAAQFDKSAEQVRSTIETKIKPAMQDFSVVMGQVFMGAISEFGQGIENLFAGTSKLEGGFSRVLGTMGKFMVQIGKMFIAWGIAQEAFATAVGNIFNPESAVAVIIAGAALVGIGSAISGMASRASSGGSSGGSPGFSGGSSLGGFYMQPQTVQVEGVLRGSDIYWSSQNYKGLKNVVT